MAKYELSETILNNLFEFLGRAPLKGIENPAFNEIIHALNSPIPEESTIENNEI